MLVLDLVLVLVVSHTVEATGAGALVLPPVLLLATAMPRRVVLLVVLRGSEVAQVLVLRGSVVAQVLVLALVLLALALALVLSAAVATRRMRRSMVAALVPRPTVLPVLVVARARPV